MSPYVIPAIIFVFTVLFLLQTPRGKPESAVDILLIVRQSPREQGTAGKRPQGQYSGGQAGWHRGEARAPQG